MALLKKEGILIGAQRNCVIYLIRPRRLKKAKEADFHVSKLF